MKPIIELINFIIASIASLIIVVVMMAYVLLPMGLVVFIGYLLLKLFRIL